MRKKVVALMLGMMMVTSMLGCGAKEGENTQGTEMVESTELTGSAETTESTEKSEPCASAAFDLKGSDYVTLCDYDNVSITITGDYNVTDETVKTYFESIFAQYGPFYTEDTEKKVIEEGDIVNVDYVGKLDDVAFDGGSAENQLIDVYNNASTAGTGYIEGFTDGLKGASVGDVIDCDVTFPEDYGNADLAGKAVVFTFTVNSIQKEITVDEVDDNFAKEQFDVDTVEEMYALVKDTLTQQAEYYKQTETFYTLQNYLVDNCTVEVPEDYLEARLADYKNQYVEYYCGGDESQLETYLSTYEGKTVEEMETTWREGLDKSIRLELVLDAIAEEMEIVVDEEEYASYLATAVTSGGYADEKALYESYGYGDAAFGERYLKELYLYDMALEKVLETATVDVDTTLAESEEVEEVTESEE